MCFIEKIKIEAILGKIIESNANMFKNLRIVSKFTHQMSSNKYITWTTPKSERFFRRKSWTEEVIHKPTKKNVKNPNIKRDISDKKK